MTRWPAGRCRGNGSCFLDSRGQGPDAPKGWIRAAGHEPGLLRARARPFPGRAGSGLELLIEKDTQAAKNIGDPSAFLGVYDEQEEELRGGPPGEAGDASLGAILGDMFTGKYAVITIVFTLAWLYSVADALGVKS